MKKKSLVLLLSFFVLIAFVILPLSVKADVDDDLTENQQEREKLEKIIAEIQEKGRTLSSQINLMNQKINLIQLQISQTKNQINALEKEIEGLSGKIEKLDVSLDKVSQILLRRIVETYKRGQLEPSLFLFSSHNAGQFLRNYKYIQEAQKHDKMLMLALEEAKQNFDTQKNLKEEKQEKLEGLRARLEQQNIALANEKKDKEYLLIATQNDAKKYNQLLDQVKAEYQAIQAILAGGGDETEIGKVNKGEVIATVISGNSCNSSGTHLHFTITENGSAVNPFSFLRSGMNYENCSGYSCGSGDGDSFNPSGSWDWPLSEKITLTQGYGHTWAVDHTWVGQIYSFHNGIDIKGGSSDIRAVQTGNLYRGSYTGYQGCRLRYVKVDHEDSNIDTYYLHVNYTIF